MKLNTKSAETIREYGTITNINHNWQTITLNQNYINPVVIVSDPTFNGTDPATVRLKNVTGNSFELRIQKGNYQKGNYQDDDHVLETAETASYFVVEAGDWELSDGTQISAGTQNSNLLSSQRFETVGISEFDQTPTLLTQVQTYNGPDWVTTRTKNMTANSFDLTMQEEEALNDGTHATETIGWLAIDQGMGTDGDTVLQGGLTEKTHTHIPETVNFEQAFDETPIVFAKLGSYFGRDPANIRLGSISNSGFEARVHEEQSHDKEINHANEQIAFLALGDSSGLFTGSSNADGNDVNSPPTDLDLDNTTLDENATPNSFTSESLADYASVLDTGNLLESGLPLFDQAWIDENNPFPVVSLTVTEDEITASYNGTLNITTQINEILTRLNLTSITQQINATNPTLIIEGTARNPTGYKFSGEFSPTEAINFLDDTLGVKLPNNIQEQLNKVGKVNIQASNQGFGITYLDNVVLDVNNIVGMIRDNDFLKDAANTVTETFLLLTMLDLLETYSLASMILTLLS